jgi:hypothetical protein
LGEREGKEEVATEGEKKSWERRTKNREKKKEEKIKENITSILYRLKIYKFRKTFTP